MSSTKFQWITLHTYLNAFSCSTTPEILDLDWLNTIDRAIIIAALLKKQNELELLSHENSRYECPASTRTNTLSFYEHQKGNHGLESSCPCGTQTKSEESVGRAIPILDSSPITLPNLHPRTPDLQLRTINPGLNFVALHQSTPIPLTLCYQVSDPTTLPTPNPYHHSRERNRCTSDFTNTSVPQPFMAPYKNQAGFSLVRSTIQPLSPLSPSFGPRKGEQFKGTTNRRRSLPISGWGGAFGSSVHAVSDKEGSKTTHDEVGEEERVLGEDVVERKRRVQIGRAHV